MGWLVALFYWWPIRQRVLLSLRNGSAIDGLLIKRTGPLLVIANATLREIEAEPTAMDGQVYIERNAVLFIQASG